MPKRMLKFKNKLKRNIKSKKQRRNNKRKRKMLNR